MTESYECCRECGADFGRTYDKPIICDACFGFHSRDKEVELLERQLREAQILARIASKGASIKDAVDNLLVNDSNPEAIELFALAADRFVEWWTAQDYDAPLDPLVELIRSVLLRQEK